MFLKKIKCPAKINLYLKIVGKRPDGYHELESLFAFLDLEDVLEIEKSDKFNLEIDGEFADLIDVKKNLITKILDFFVKEFNISRNLKIKITKNIPVGAGLGGGSSDAAYFIKSLNNIFNLKLTKEELQRISLNFGSDIAFFFEDKASIIRGRGEIIKNFPKFKTIHALLVNPKIHLLTKDVFGRFAQEFSKEISNQELQKKDVEELIKSLPNDLTKAAIASNDIIAEILKQLEREKAVIAKMSGSGATCFAIFSDDKQLEAAQKNLTKKFPNFFIKKAKILSDV